MFKNVTLPIPSKLRIQWNLVQWQRYSLCVPSRSSCYLGTSVYLAKAAFTQRLVNGDRCIRETSLKGKIVCLLVLGELGLETHT